MHREQLVVGVVRDEVLVGLCDLGAHQQCEHPADQEEHQRAGAQVQPDAFVVGTG
jgi:hypothetical protein